MVEWKTTAATIYCESVDDEITLLVAADGATACTGQQRFGNPDKENARLLEEKARQAGRTLACTGPDCTIITRYRTKLLNQP